MESSMVRVWTSLIALQLLVAPTVICAQQAPSVQRRELASLRADIQLLAERCRHLTGAVEALTKDCTELSRQLEAANRKIGAVEDRAQRDEMRIVDLERVVAEEIAARKTGDERTIQVVAEEIARMLDQSRLRDPPPEVESVPRGIGTYTVSRGDTLTAIAEAFGVALGALRAENDLTGDLIREGQRLRIPLPAQRPAERGNQDPNNVAAPDPKSAGAAPER